MGETAAGSGVNETLLEAEGEGRECFGHWRRGKEGGSTWETGVVDTYIGAIIPIQDKKYFKITQTQYQKNSRYHIT